MLLINLPESVKTAIDTLKQCGHRAYIVGGCVRDSIRGVIPSDWDICTSATPDAIISAFSEYTTIKTGIAHGTVTVLINNTPLEITTFRIDGEYQDMRHPQSVSFTDSLELDLSRRDFTVNAIAYSPEDGIIDPFNGKKDIENKTIRCVGKADLRFSEDALRLLRALRFSSVLSFSIEIETAKSIHRNAHLLSKIAIERVNSEFTKLICGIDAKNVLSEFRDVISIVIPELEKTFDFCQHTKYHIYDVWNHTLHALNNISPTPVLRLSMLFHDIGKPLCFTQDSDGTGHFYGHPKVSTEIAHSTLHRLRYDNQTIERVCTLIKYHDSDIICQKKYILRWLNKIGIENFIDLLKVKEADNKAQNPEFSYIEKINELRALYHSINEKDVCFSTNHLSVNGHDLINAGITEGRKIGIILNDLLNVVIEEKLPNEKNSLLSYVNKHYK